MSQKAVRAQRRVRDATVDRYLRAFMAELRRIFARDAKASYSRFPKQPKPCPTCAFNKATDGWKGWDSTAWGLMRAIEADKPFYCHHKRSGEEWPIGPSGEYALEVDSPELRPCGGWLGVVGSKDTKLAFLRAALAAEKSKEPS